ncbi:hypothetical protein PTKIN_Ptkin09bG0075400 [Pterospermum kingtungense]
MEPGFRDDEPVSCSCLEKIKILVDQTNHKNLIILLLQFLQEQNFQETLHSLERESKVFFNMFYFGETIINGEWVKAEKYLSAFIGPYDNDYSYMSFFKLQDQKQRENRQPSWHVSVTAASERANLLCDLKTLVEKNPMLQEKLVLPRLNRSAFFHLMKRISPSPEKDITSFKEELIFLILQFLDEEKFYETVHKLEQESKVFFNVNYFGQLVINGEWCKVEKYLSAFTNDNDEFSAKILYEMRKHEDLDAKDRNDCDQRGDVLLRDLKAFPGSNSKILNELMKELSLENFWGTKVQSEYLNTSSLRANLLHSLQMRIEGSLILRDKCKFPYMQKARLLTIIKLAMDWWVPYHVSLTNQIISFENIPTVPYLCHCPSPVIESTSEGGNLEEPNGYRAGVRSHLGDVHSVVGVNQIEKSVKWKLKEIKEPFECRVLMLPDCVLAERVVRLIYSSSGDFLLALAEDAKHKLWTWKHSSGKASVNVPPQLYQPSSGVEMTNEKGASHQNQCFALNDSYLYSASGGNISIFCLDTFNKLAIFGKPPQTCTYFTFVNKHTFALGFNDSSIIIRCLRTQKNQAKLEGHQKHITCLAFSSILNVLVSAGADAQLCVWNANSWEKLATKCLHSLCSGNVSDPPVVNFIQFHQDQVHLLAVHEKLIDIYEAPLLNHVLQWVPSVSDLPITSATYSSNGQLIYVSFKTGCIKVLVSTTLDVRCHINPTAYAQPNASLQVYPLVIAAHPSNAYQIALGLSNGTVNVLEPLESEEWGESPPL